MPTYRYKCGQCGTFETVQSMFDEPLQHCDCGEPVRRVVFAPPVKFSGPGFYSTAYNE